MLSRPRREYSSGNKYDILRYQSRKDGYHNLRGKIRLSNRSVGSADRNIIKIRCLLYFFFFGDTLSSDNIPSGSCHLTFHLSLIVQSHAK